MNTLLIAVVSIALSVAAQFALKTGMSSEGTREMLSRPFTIGSIFTVLSDWHVLGGFVLYGLGAIVWLGVLAKWDVSKAYPLVGLGFVFTVGIGFVAGEHIGWPRMAGVALICTGVLLVAGS
jgi:multidrug transporter EmrE-like cation transporter